VKALRTPNGVATPLYEPLYEYVYTLPFAEEQASKTCTEAEWRSFIEGVRWRYDIPARNFVAGTDKAFHWVRTDRYGNTVGYCA